MTIAAFAAGAERGYLYIRGEYPARGSAWRTRSAGARRGPARAATSMGAGGRSTSSFGAAPGAYICGEETALFESIEGKRGEPRNKPPFPVEAGLFGKPTAINNVETLANVPRIVPDGGAAFAAIGPRVRPARSCSASPATSRGRASTRWSSARRSATCIELAGGVAGRQGDQADPAGRGGGRLCRRPTGSTCR